MPRLLLALIAIICSIILTGSNTVFAQNNGNQTSSGVYSTNLTKATILNSTGIAKLHLEEAIKALESANKQEASTRLTAALQGVAQASNEVKLQFNEGMKAFTAGNINDTLIHLRAAIKELK